MKLSLLVFLIGAVSVSVHSQPIEKDVIEWTVNNLNDIESNVDTVYNCKFITYGVKQIEWIQGDYVIHLKVRRSQGSWSDLKRDGSVTFMVSMNDKPGKISFSRKSGDVKIDMEFKEGSKNSTPYEFVVSATKKIEP